MGQTERRTERQREGPTVFGEMKTDSGEIYQKYYGSVRSTTRHKAPVIFSVFILVVFN